MESLNIAFRVFTNEHLGRNFASHVLEMALSSFRTSALLRPPPPRLTSLSIENVPSDYMSTSLDFSELLQNVRNLKLRTTILQHGTITSRTFDPNTQTSLTTFDPNIKTLYWWATSFYARLPRLWLVPASQNLKVLHLSSGAPWGWDPKTDFRSIHFPNLEELMLFRFIFSHDWPMPWLSNHARSLKRLTLIECAILDHASATERIFDSEGYPLGREPRRQHTRLKKFYQYTTRWSDYFEWFAKSLPNLHSFSLLDPDIAIRDTHHQDVLDGKMFWASRNHDHYLKHTSGYYTPLFNDWGAYWDRIYQKDVQALRELLAVTRRHDRTWT